MSAALHPRPPLSADRRRVRTFLGTIFAYADAGYLPVWTLPDKRTRWLPITDLDAIAETMAALSDAGKNVYFGPGLHESARGENERGTADQVRIVPGLWADVDYGTIGHKGERHPPTAEDALGLFAALPIAPTVIVHSGHGWYGYLLFREPFVIETPAERAMVRGLNDRFQHALKTAAAARGWAVDSTSSLDHVLRPAGVPNLKPGCTPVMVRGHGTIGDRYSLDELDARLPLIERADRRAQGPSTANDEPAGERPDSRRIFSSCAYARHVRDDAATLTEPEWHAGLSIIALCEGGERLAHEISSPYPGYTHQETQQKFERARDEDKPMTCATIRYDRCGEACCSTCGSWGRITSPIELGRPVRRLHVVGTNPSPVPTSDATAPTADPAPEPFALTDLGNAQRLVSQHGADLRYCHPWGKWLVWEGQRWRLDDTGEIARRAKQTVRAVYAEAAEAVDLASRQDIAKHAVKSENEARIEAMIALAESEPGIPVRPDDLDRNRWRLACHNGVIDLRTGELHAADRAGLITKLAPVAYDPHAECPTFRAFLDRIMAGNAGLIEFLRRALGYSLTGLTVERILIILYGEGRDGKSTLLEVVRAVLGDYAKSTPTETLLARRDGGGIPNDIAALKGIRFATASEANENRRLDEAKVKLLTGGDTITARFLHREWFDFQPQFTIWLATNFKPIIRGQDRAIWDRLRLVPFSVRIPDDEQDRHLRDKLIAEGPGILAWAVRGCLDWQDSGLTEPPEVKAATQGYRSEMDTFGTFLADCCVAHPQARCRAAALYAAYRRWCEENGEHAITQTAFGRTLTDRGFAKGQESGGDRARTWEGIGLPDDAFGGNQWAP